MPNEKPPANNNIDLKLFSATKMRRRLPAGVLDLEPEIWLALQEIADREGCSINDLVALVKVKKNPGTMLASATTLFTMMYFRAAATDEGHKLAGHGDFQLMRERAGVATDDPPNA